MAKKLIKDYKFVPGVIPPAYGLFPNAVNLLTQNKEFIVKEVSGWLQYQTSTPSYKLSAGVSTTYAQAILTANKTFIQDEACAYIDSQIASNSGVFAGYVFDATKRIKCKRDIGYLIDAFIVDLAGGGNAETIRITNMFNLNGQAQLLNPIQEAAVHTFVKTLMVTYVLDNTPFISTQSPVTSTQDTSLTIAEDNAITKVGELNDIVINFISNNTLPGISYNFNQTFANYVYGATKCKRDIAYILEAVGFDLVLGSNYNAIFQGRAESNSLSFDSSVVAIINASRDRVLALTDVAASGTAVTSVTTDYAAINTIAAGGSAPSVTYTNPSSATTSQIAVKDRLVANKAFIQAEVNAWVALTYPSHNHSEAKCARDVGYAVDSFAYDLLYGGNSATYDNGKFFFYSGASGITEAHKAQTVAAYGRLKTIIGQIVRGETVSATTTGGTPNALTQDLSGNSASSGDASLLEDLAQVISDIVNNGLTSLPATRITPDVAWSTTALKLAQTAITNASTTIQNAVVTYSDYTYNDAKCQRDTEYIIDAYIYDMTYGGNSLTYYVASQYQINNVVQVNRPQVEVLAQTFARDLINDYILQNKYHPNYQLTVDQTVLTGVNAESTATTEITKLAGYVTNTIANGLSALPAVVAPDNQSNGLMPNTVVLLEANKKFIQEEAIAFIQYGIDNNISPFIYYTYNAVKCRRDVSYILEGYLSDLKRGGNKQTCFNAGKYWENGVAQVDGDRQPEIQTHTFIRDLIDNFILTSTPYTAKQILVKQYINTNLVPETFANTRIKELSNTIINVIQYGITYLPTSVTNRGYLKVAGFYKLKDFLLITNTSRNTILYNFADPLAGGEATYSEYFDSDFPAALYGVDKITTITFDVDTSGHMVTDQIQIFVENKEGQEVRLNKIGTDAMERMRVGIPQSMLDADFEYGLQPTKWQALALLRNYPSIYEIPGSDLAVISVTTDASSGTAGTGASKITVVTQSSHGLSVGDPITIKALANSVSGFSRSEGSFLVAGVDSLSQFFYYAKSKVGTVPGTLLSSTYTQLRKAGFYTGSAVGTPSFSVFSSGSSGTITTSLITPSGSDIIGFTGTVPPVGSPLSGTGLTSGAQVTAVTGPGGTAATTKLATAASIGDTVISVVSTTGISTGLIFDRGDGQAVTVTNVSGQNISLSGPLTSAIVGNAQTYTTLTGTNGIGTGAGGVFTVSRSGNTYTASASNPGGGYAVNNTVVILGTSLGGTTTTNDATITITGASAINSVATLNAGSLVGGTGYSDATNVPTTSSVGTGLTVDIVTNGSGVITSALVNVSGSGYAIGDTITITTGNGDATILVATVNAGGLITSVSVAGTPITAPDKNFISAFTISESTTAQIASGNTGITFSSIATIQVTFTTPHGFIPGNTVTVQITSAGTGAQLAAGPFFVEQVPNATTLRYTARAAGAIDNTLAGVIYARPDSFFVHRPFDGGVQLGTASPSHGATAIRMSKKYIRYQSGKGVMYNTGALFAPSYDLQKLQATSTSIGAFITVTTDDTDHGLQVGGGITISGVQTSGYNGDYIVADIVNERVFRVIATKPLGATTAIIGSPCIMSVRSWHGATIRSGIFDDQNGMFWQYDGIRMAVVRRSSTFQITGTIAIAANSNQITGTNTRFVGQLAQGDRIVIRGMTHIVSKIDSDTSMSVTPDFRGVSDVVGAKAVKTIDLVIPQEWWNLDTLNGAGGSGYNLDVTKMQMIGIQHTWYGAGFIDFMLRGPEGNYTFAHRFRNSNVNTEAYMRTGNQPVRYEVINEGAKGKTTAAMTINQTTIPMNSDYCYWFPNSGTVIIDNELISYTGNSGTALTGCTRAAVLTQFVAGSQRNFSGGAATTHTTDTGVVLVSNTITPNISHWGSAFMIDGQFDSDRGYIFNYAATGINASVDKSTAFLIRLAPSVSNAQIGDLGEKELLNRAQLLLSAVSITSDSVANGGAIVVEGVLNPSNYPTDPTKITWTGLASSAAGGQPSFAQIAAGGSVTWSGSQYTTQATVQGAFTTTLTAKSFAPATNTLTARAFNAVTQTASVPAITSVQNATYQFAFDSARSDFLIPQSTFAAFTTPLAANDSITLASPTTITGVVINSQIGTFTCTSTTLRVGETITITGTISNSNSTLSNVNITGTAGQFSCNSGFTLTVGQTVTINGIIGGGGAGTISGYSTGPTTYVISATNGSTTFTLTQLNGTALVTSAGNMGNPTPATVTANAPSISGYTSGTQYKISVTNGSTSFTLTTMAGVALTTTGGIPTGLTYTYTNFLQSNQKVLTTTANYITINSIVYARIIMTAPATLTSLTNVGVTNVTFTSSVAAQYNTALSTARTDFLVTQAEYAATTAVVTDVLSATTYLTGGQGISSVTPNYTTIGGTSYARVVMTATATATSVAGASNPVTITATSAATTAYASAISTGRSDFLITDASYTGTGIAVGDVLSLSTYITGGQTILTITPSYISIGGTLYTRIVMSAVSNATSTGGGGNDQTVTVTAAGSGATYVSKNYLFFTSSTWLASGAAVGTKLSASAVTQFPAGTSVAQISTRTFGATTVYRVTFTQTSNATISAGATPTFQFGAFYALPGEQVFSFIANPGESSTLSLEALKELTATAIGGRGTFPNGPDVLAINVYKVTGTQTPANIILRWGEAQA